MKMHQCFFLLGVLVWGGVSAFAETLSYADLAGRLADLKGLAVLPVPGERCAQASSYDRASVYNVESKAYENWDANGDGEGIIREEEGLQVLAEMNGPGVIWRIWSAAPEGGKLVFILDGKREPMLNLPFVQFFDAKTPPFDFPELSFRVAGDGANCYVPIPFNHSCKVLAEPGWGKYYHFTYSQFPEGTQLPAVSEMNSPVSRTALQQANDAFAQRGKVFPEPSIRKTTCLSKGQSNDVAQLEGAGAITCLRARIHGLPEDQLEQRRLLRALTVAMYWDGDKSPSVWAPFGDFFGTSAGANAYASYPMGLTEDGWWYSCWYMPYADGARVACTNDADQSVKIDWEITSEPFERTPPELGRFHAKWHRDALLPQDPARAIDWTLLSTEGRGRYVGTMLYVYNPKGSWWGEGDEKFFVDGETFPSTFGTGSEDYFGYAWCNPALFSRAVINQTISGGNIGHISVNRWHIADNIPFQTRFDGYIEKYFPNDRPTQYAAMAYWYLEAGKADAYSPVPVEKRIEFMDWESGDFHVKGAIEGEEMKVLSVSNTSIQEMSTYGAQWSSLQQLFITDEQGAVVELEFPVKESGLYEVRAAFTTSYDYGIVQALLDGEPIGKPFDGYSPNVAHSGELSLGARQLEKGGHVLSLKMLDKNEQSSDYYAGLDYLKLNKASKK